MSQHEKIWIVPLWRDAEKYGKELLSAEEKGVLSTLQHPARRLEWIGGRILLKRLVWEESSIPCSWEKFGRNISPSLQKTFSQWTVRTRNSLNQGIPPQIFVKNHPLKAHFSLSHTAGYLAVIRSPENHPTGCDLCSPDSFSCSAQRFFLHSEEKKFLSQCPPDIPEEIFWGGKEAAYKVRSIRHLEPFQPLHWQIRFPAHRWEVIHRCGQVFSLEFRQISSVFLFLAREG